MLSRLTTRGVMQAIETYCTTTVRPHERLQFWNLISNRIFSGTQVRSADPVFDAEMWWWRVGSLSLLRPRCPVAVVDRYGDPQGRDPTHVVLHLQHRGTSRVLQGSQAAQLCAGDLVLNTPTEHYRLDVLARTDMLSVEMPIAPLEQRYPDIREALGQRLPGTSSAVQMLHSYLLCLWQSGFAADVSDEWLEDAEAVFYSLLGAAVRNGRRGPASAVTKPLVHRLKALVQARLEDADLGTHRLAREAGVSPRSVQNAFAEVGLTPSMYITHCRLEKAASLLSVQAGRAVTEIAHECGFNDSGYFSRCFRAHYGVAPSAWRKG